MAGIKTLWMSLLILLCIPVMKTYASEPYCGVYCLYAGCDALGVKTEFESLLSNKYVTDWSGSTLDSLALAANDLGLASQKVNGLGRLDLHCAQSPVILHVRSDSTRPDFDHWVLFLGATHGKAKIVDPNVGELLLPFEELLTLWDGAGLAISKSSNELRVWQLSGFLMRVLTLCGLAFSASFVLRKWTRSQWVDGHHPNLIPGAIGLLSFLAVFGFMMDHFVGGRLLANPYPSLAMTNLYLPVAFPEIERAELVILLNEKSAFNDVLLVDARMAKDFPYDPLPNAISIPIDGSPIDEQETTHRIDKKSRLILYCQSSGCTYSDVVAKRLRARGYENISIYREGVTGWRNALSKDSDGAVAPKLESE